MQDGVIDLEYTLGDLHHPGLEGQGDGGVARAQLDLDQPPDAVGQLEALVDHVLALQSPLGHSKGLKAGEWSAEKI